METALSVNPSDAARPDGPAMRQCVTCKRLKEAHHFTSLTSTGREVKSCQACRLNSKRKHEKKRLRQSQVEKRVERLKRRIEVVYSQAALAPEVRKVIDQALLLCIGSNRTT